MNVYLCMYVHTHTHIHTHTYIHTYTHIHTHIHTQHTHRDTHTQTHTHTDTHTHTHTHTHVHTRTHTTDFKYLHKVWVISTLKPPRNFIASTVISIVIYYCNTYIPILQTVYVNYIIVILFKPSTLVVCTYIPGNNISFTRCGLKTFPPNPYELKNSANCK